MLTVGCRIGQRSPLFILYPSEYGQPKGLLHTTACSCCRPLTTTWVFALKDEDFTGARGELAGHRAKLRRYGPLSNGATVLSSIAPNHPERTGFGIVEAIA